MKKPILGKQTFMPGNKIKGLSFDKFVKEVYEKEADTKPLYTGRYFLILNNGNKSFEKANKLFKTKLGFSVANTRDFLSESINESKIQGADALIYEDLGVALFGGEEEQMQLLESAEADYHIEPEKIVYVPDDAPASLNIPATWGITITKSITSQYSGMEVKVAVLDTGFDIDHPDFIGRNVVTESFVTNELIQDLHGHGTHCIGTACGSIDQAGQRYGVATDSIIYAGKVLSNQGSGAQAWILNGMNWAANNGCKVISMSLGSKVFAGQGFDIPYERAANYALSKGSVVLAAAGNDSKRSCNQFKPVTSPADCPSVLAIAALDSNLDVADFSNRAINPTGQVDIAAPGVNIYSSWPMPMRCRTSSGTSMATPHVAGLIALLWEKYPTASPAQIISELRNNAQKLPLLTIDVGAGLALAP